MDLDRLGSLSAWACSNKEDCTPKPKLNKPVCVSGRDRSPQVMREEREELKVFEQNPQLATLCNLPINATIVIFMFHCGERSLPETQTG